MASMRVSVSHQLTQAEALKRIKRAIAHAKKENSDKVRDLEENWNGYVGSFAASAVGHSVTGSVAIDPAEVIVTGKLPFFAMPFKRKIEAAIEDMLARLLK